MPRSLGTLTLDLIARTAGFAAGMSKAERASDKWRRKVKKDAEVVGKALGIGITGATTALTALTVRTLNQSRELSQLAAISQTTTTEFQRQAAGARQLGIDNQKLADIFKDVNDRVGDFLITGGGPLADFFDVIAPRVGVTAEQFKNLSGPQALQLFVNTLQDAGANSQELTFFLEALSSDATSLLPLLADNGRLLKAFGDEAAEAGAILDERLIRQATLLDEQLQDLKRTTQGISNEIALAAIPVFNELLESFGSARIEGNKLAGSGDVLGTVLRSIAVGATLASGTVTVLAKRVGATAAIFAALGRQDGEGFFSTAPLDRAATVAAEVNADIEETNKFFAKLAADLASGGLKNPLSDLDNGAAETGSNLDDLFKKLADLNSGGAGAGSGTSETSGIADTIKDLEMQIVALQNTEEFFEDYKLQLAGATDQQRAYASELRGTISTLEAEKAALKEVTEAQEQTNQAAEGIRQSLRTEEEAIRESYERRRQIILDNTSITGDARQNLLLRLEAETNAQLLQLNDDFWSNYLRAAERTLTNLDEVAARTINNFASQFGGVVESIVFDAESLDDALLRLVEGFARASVNALAELGAQWLVYKAVQQGANRTAQAASAKLVGANAVAQQQLAALNAFASTAAIPVTGPALAPAAAASALAATSPFVAAATSAALAGIAHDGLMSVPTTGTYLLEKGERVTTEKTSAKLDSMIEDARAGAGEIGLSINNYIGERDVVELLAGRMGERVVLNHIKANQRTIKSLARS